MESSNSQLLRQKAYTGLEEKNLSRNPEYLDRLEYELGVIEQLGFVPYFLVMWDICNFARRNKIKYGPGRGSACSSLVCYCLKITLVDPIKYNLYFERFLNPSRVSPPDVDWDTSDRERIIDYLKERYGEDKVARVGSLNFLRTKSAIKDIGRTLGKDFKETEELSKLVPPPVAGLWTTFEKECEIEPRLLNEKYEDIIKPAGNLWGVVRSYGTHAGGVAISPVSINQVIPLYKDKDGNPVSQFDWRDLEEAGLLKFDILGLKTLEIIQLCSEFLEKRNIFVDFENLEGDDEKTYDLICSGNLDGIFQLGGSQGIRQLTLQIAPRNVEDLSLIGALFRPGPLSSGMVGNVVNIRQGKNSAVYLAPELEPILSSTYGVIVFQEQVMKICTDICGYTMAEADNMRKILGKKLQEKMIKEKDKFVSGGAKTIGEDKAIELFNSIEGYASYLFNAAHSLAYSIIAYWTAYLKTYYPIEFYTSLLACEKDPDMVIQYVSSARENEIEILPPDINLSDYLHKPEGNGIRYGLSHIKGMPTSIAKSIIELRNEKNEI